MLYRRLSFVSVSLMRGLWNELLVNVVSDWETEVVIMYCRGLLSVLTRLSHVSLQLYFLSFRPELLVPLVLYPQEKVHLSRLPYARRKELIHCIK